LTGESEDPPSQAAPDVSGRGQGSDAERQAARRLRAERALAASERRFETLLEAAPDAVVGSDEQGLIVLANARTEQLFGYTRDELLGRPVELLMPERVRDVHVEHRRGYVSQPRARLMSNALDLVGRHKSGREFPVEIALSPVHVGAGLQVISIVRDVSERRSLEGQLRQSQKMEALGRLAGGVAHDFNNLLMVIQGYVDLLLDEMDSEGELRSHVQQLKVTTERAAALTGYLLAVSRKQVLQAQPLDLNDCLRALDGVLRRVLGEGIELVTELQAAPAVVLVDPGQLEQVLLNLVVNARDAMSEGGRLSIGTTNVTLDQEFARLHVGAREGEAVRLTVTDTGRGMDEATRVRVFEPFFTTKLAGKGTGLGMSTVYGVVTQSDGYIWIDSAPDQGTTVEVYLPRADEGALPLPVEAADAFRGTETILVAEGQSRARGLLRDFLESIGYRVLLAAEGIEGERLAGQHRGAIDLFLVDSVLPGQGGLDLMERVAADHPQAKVIYLCGPGQGPHLGGRLRGLSVVVLKRPIPLATLAREIRKLLGEPGHAG